MVKTIRILLKPGDKGSPLGELMHYFPILALILPYES